MAQALAVHNEKASVANIARSILLAVDPGAMETRVPTATLTLLLETLIDLAEPKAPERNAEQERTVRQLVAQVETAVKNRDEDQQQANGGESSKRRQAWG